MTRPVVPFISPTGDSRLGISSWGSSLLGVTAVAAAVLAAAPAWANAGEGYYGHHGMMGGAHWIFGPLMMLVFLVLVVGAVVIAVRLLSPRGGSGAPGGPDRALDILRERFARGEIDRAEYEERRGVLG
jgi:putative membrane protein